MYNDNRKLSKKDVNESNFSIVLAELLLFMQ